MSILRLAKRRYRRDGVIGLLRSIPAYLSKPLRLRFQRILLSVQDERTVTRNGVTISLDNDVLRDSSSLILGNYETDEIHLIDAYLPRDCDVIELGGGIGYTSCYINRLIDPSRTQMVVEANPELIPLLKKHREMNESGYQIHHAAYAPDAESVSFNLNPGHLYGSVYYEGDRSVTVEAIDLETLLDGSDIDSFVLVADIEGAEVDLIENELALIKKQCPMLIIEFHDEFHDGRAARRELEAEGFDLVTELDGTFVYGHTGR